MRSTTANVFVQYIGFVTSCLRVKKLDSTLGKKILIALALQIINHIRSEIDQGEYVLMNG